jgi:hypothetical protein
MENYISIKEAAKFMNRSRRWVEDKIAETRAGLNDFPYYQDAPHAQYDFLISELRLWRFNRKLKMNKRKKYREG